MFRNFSQRRGQSFVEHAMLVIVIATALVAMQVYIQRAINARLKQVQVELNESRR